MTVKERISKFYSTKGYSMSAFERVIGKKRGYWCHTDNPTADTLVSVFATFPELSTEYVFRGEGDMVKKQGGEADPNVEKYYESIIKVKNERIDQLERELAKLRVICEEGKSTNGITNSETSTCEEP
jgi:hypothetical protein